MTAAETWLRVVLYKMQDADAGHYQASLAYIRSNIEQYTRSLERQPGFEGAQWGVDLDDGRVAAVSRWTSLHSILGASGELGRLQADAEAHGVRRAHVQNIRIFPLPETASTEDRDVPPTVESWLRVVTYRVAEDQRAANYMMFSIQDCLRVLEKQPGFQRGYWGRGSSGGVLSAVTYWTTRDAIVAAGPALQELQLEAAANGIRPMEERNIHLFAVTAGA